MTKRIWKSVCAISLAVMLIDVGIFIATVLPTLQQPNVAIIGGADGPTATYITHVIVATLIHSPFFIVGVLAFFLFAVSGIALIYKKLHCGTN